MPFSKKLHGETSKLVSQVQDGSTGISGVIGLVKAGMQGAVATKDYSAMDYITAIG